MKIFGFNITRPSTIVDAPAQPVKVAPVAPLPGGKDVAVIPTVKSSAYTYMAIRGSGRGVFEAAEYDLAIIGRVEDTESYVRQAFKKKTGLMFKEGYEFVGPNKQTLSYVKTRVAQIARASGIPTTELVRCVGAALIKKSNCFLVKVRKTEASGGKLRTTPEGKLLKPVAAYFVIPAETMTVDSDEFGRIRKWRQLLPTGAYKDFGPDDVIHFYFDRKEGLVMGTPTIVPVLDDIRALRKIEENIELLVYQHLFPLFHYQVGTPEQPATITERGEREVDVVKREIQYMPSEGGIVTPERHKITMIGAEGRALHAEGYVDHFKKRVFAGLGVSAVDLGEGETANRATADNMSRALIDDVKDFQGVLETQFEEFIIKELLLESTFGDEVLNEENLVHIKFFEIDIDKKIKLETHAADQFVKHAILWPELRQIQGRDPVLVPLSNEDDPTKFPEWQQSYFKLFQEPLALIVAQDEPFSTAAIAASENKNTSLEPKSVAAAGEAATEAEVKKIKAKPKPPARKIANAIADNYLSTMYSELEENIAYDLQRIDMRYDIRHTATIVRAQITRMSRLAMLNTINSFISGWASVTYQSFSPETMAAYRADAQKRVDRYLERLSNSLIHAIGRQVDKSDQDDKISLVRSVFSALEYRTRLFTDIETRKSYNYGRLLALKGIGHNEVLLEGKEAQCDSCTASHNTKVAIAALDLDSIPPYHGTCNCTINIVKEED